VGIEVVYAEKQQDIEKALNRMARAGYAVIYITEAAAELAQETIDRYKTQALPAIIPIPNRNGTTGLGMQGIKSNIEKAIGADILFGEGR
jgi:V/A-type H+-transporting ATPase subunit F